MKTGQRNFCIGESSGKWAWLTNEVWICSWSFLPALSLQFFVYCGESIAVVLEIKPQSPRLSRYIYEFNVLEAEEDFCTRYHAFPQKGSSIALFGNVQLERFEDHLRISPSAEPGKARVELLGKYLKPIQISYSGPVPEIAINFTPVGINHFFTSTYHKMGAKNFQPIELSAWQNMAGELWQLPDDGARIPFLEQFLESQLPSQPSESLLAIEKAVELMESVEEIQVKEIARTIGMNEKTFVRNFKRYAGCSPVQLKRILRFRRSIDLRLLNASLENLTQVAVEGLFYDSSHFGREYKLLTGQSPKAFFHLVSFQKDSKYPYLFV